MSAHGHDLRRRWGLGALSVVIVVGGVVAASGSAGAAAPKKVRVAEHPIAGRYIVVLKDHSLSRAETKSTAGRLADAYGGRLRKVYGRTVKGFAVGLSAKEARDLANDPSVAFVEQDGVVSIDATQANPPSYGLDRIDQRNLPLDSGYTYSATAGNVTAYIIDTGIRTTHTTFGGRATVGVDEVGDGQNGQDCHGHGTHVAGTVGGAQYGVAKDVKLVAVRVLGCDGSGSTSGVIAGVDWVTSHAVKPAVANMSLGGGTSTALDNAVKNSIASGVTYALAAGNDNTDACNGSPARVPEAITVNATTDADARASYSNYGTCTDIFAPGSYITSSWDTSDTATNTISGTSMATPHVTGAAALYLSAHPTATPSAVASALITAATPNVVTDPGAGSPNRLLYTGTVATPPPPPPPADCAAQLLRNAGFESGAAHWKATSGVITKSAGNAHAGSYEAWLDGYGYPHTDTLQQTLTIPAGCKATLSYWLRITTFESTAVAYDRLKVTVNGKVVGSFSNMNRGGYKLRTVSLNGYAGQTVKIRWTGAEDSSLPTSFFVDDAGVKLS